ncbi:hypothetical protein P153DRAFT_365283 [Dothidotthia symphoricarpi CBS 119687]|uniref:Uncharacterized protein n=1 Tax=Dothidotthia symphoricarpi CBS 119687 TaxID=1392245 RepID=A0A6A6AIC1_9PLEO|nr:uncharacterized protein P153DRAFT_365283 [Dothidotthia symphoricarpi CBS 119687]KAF2131712.1 hypothetical protein P153DRAFT_365283 [Dothidotthia symphoricarpi CBS 119687]
MVLQDVNDNAPDSFTDNPSPSENDPYASTSPSSGYRFDSSSLPQPLPIIGPLIGFSDRAVRFKTETTIKFAERKVGRYLNPEESQALAAHIYQLEQTKSYFAATGAAAGAYRWYTTMDKFRYPFYQPKLEEINPNRFGFVKGPMANYARHSWRFSLYVVVAGQMGNIIGQMLAQPLAAQRTSQDPKLEQFGNELKVAVGSEQKKNVEQGRQIEDRRKEFQERLQREKKGGIAPPPPRRAQSGDDDMSPTAGNEAWGSAASSQGSWGDGGFASDDSQPKSQQQQNPAYTNPRTRRPPPQSSSPFDDDDASPTGGMFQDEVATNAKVQSQPLARPGESTWEALRRGARPASVYMPAPRAGGMDGRRAEPERREQREESTLGDSFTFVEGDEERKRERERAQREFDERIERERQGRDFESEERKKW